MVYYIKQTKTFLFQFKASEINAFNFSYIFHKTRNFSKLVYGNLLGFYVRINRGGSIFNMNKKQIWVRLPKKTMYQTFCVVLDYLEKSNKITYDIKGNVVWIFNSGINKKLQDIIARSVAV